MMFHFRAVNKNILELNAKYHGKTANAAETKQLS